jgi:hypothetical protein
MPASSFTPFPEQQQVIDHRGGHLQVITCAGAGKTPRLLRDGGEADASGRN